MAKAKLTKLKLEPLKVTCTSTDCENDRHCFLATRKMKQENQVGACRECGVELVDWERVHKQDSADAQHTFESLKHELIRHHFWHVTIDETAVNYAKRKGVNGLELAVRSRLRNSIGKPADAWDGRQTPMEGSGNPIHYAQHATATCCRKCVEYWHGIPKTRALSEEETDYLSELAMMFLLDRLPTLTEDGEHVPPIRK